MAERGIRIAETAFRLRLGPQMNINNHKYKFLLQDTVIILLSILLALVLVKTDVLIKLLTSTRELEFLGSFVAGLFFTSIFTVVPAAVALGEIARTDSIVLTAFFGAIGAVIGDLFIFRFIKDKLSEHLLELLKHQGGFKRLRVLLKLKYFRWLTFLIGGLIIVSPLPDELGISILGFSRTRVWPFIILSFVANFIGILLIGSIARTL